MLLRPAQRNDCLYCVVANGALLRIYVKNPLIADQVAVTHMEADMTLIQRAMLNCAIKVCLDSASISEIDYVALNAHGFDDENIWDITAITAFFGMYNRIVNAILMRPNAEFYLMGRMLRA